MSNPRPPRVDPLLSRLAATDDAASLAILTHLCRRSPGLRHWLSEDFGRDPAIRKRFVRLVESETQAPPLRFADLTADNAAWREERRRLREQLPTRPYGGLARSEVETLIRHYQAGALNLGTFLLVHDWREPGAASPALLWAGIQFLDSTLPARQWRFVKQLGKVFAFLRRYENKTKRRSAVGYADWWKVQVLFYLLRHPRDSYRTRELLAHLGALGVRVSTKDIRRFCMRHHIRRDMRSGRPRTRAT